MPLQPPLVPKDEEQQTYYDDEEPRVCSNTCYKSKCGTWTAVVLLSLIVLTNVSKLPYYWPDNLPMTNVTYNAAYCERHSDSKCWGIEASPILRIFAGDWWRGKKILADPSNFIAPHAMMGVFLDVLLVAQLLDNRKAGLRFISFLFFYALFLLHIIPETEEDGIPDRLVGCPVNLCIVIIGIVGILLGVLGLTLCKDKDCGRGLIHASWVISAVTLNSAPLMEWAGMAMFFANPVSEGDKPAVASGHDWYAHWGSPWYGWTFTLIMLFATVSYVIYLSYLRCLGK